METKKNVEDCDHSDSVFVVLDEDGAHYECKNCDYEWVDTSTIIEDEGDDDDETDSSEDNDDDFDDDDDFEDEIDIRNI